MTTRTDELAAEEFRIACLRQKDVWNLENELTSVQQKLVDARAARDESLTVVAQLGVHLKEAVAVVKAGPRKSEHLNFDHFLDHFEKLQRTGAE